MPRLMSLMLFACLSLSLSCTRFVEQRVTLTPAFDGVHHTIEFYNTGSCWPFTLDRRGVGSPEQAQWWAARRDAGEMGLLTGYSNDFSRGADPFPCNLWIFHLFQAKLLFDFQSLPRGAVVTDARLVSSMRMVLTRARGFLETSRDCAFELGEARSVIIGDYTLVSGRSNAVSYLLARPDFRPYAPDMNVTRTVTGWVNGGRENFGFVVSPESERVFREQENQQSAVYCAAYLSDVSLELTLVVPET